MSGGVVTKGYPVVWMYCKRCGWETPHRIKDVMESYAWWKCDIKGCGKVRSGAHPDRGWVRRQLEEGR